jgi:hypothetical protein
MTKFIVFFGNDIDRQSSFEIYWKVNSHLRIDGVVDIPMMRCHRQVELGSWMRRFECVSFTTIV